MSNRMEGSEFVPHGARLADGKSIRAKHCNNNPTMIVSRSGAQVTARCFRCDAWGHFEERESLQDKLTRLSREANADAEALLSFTPPEPRVYELREWPEKAALWLYRMGFSPSMIAEFGAWWCPTTKRVVLPVSQNGQVIFWQGRSIDRKPKIISPQMPRRGLVAKYGINRGSAIVLCEDALSAYKVGRVCEAWSLLGTKLLDGPFTDLLKQGKPVVVWLDSDDPGRKSAAKIRKTLRAYGIEVRDVCTPKDPKWYSREFITEVLCH